MEGYAGQVGQVNDSCGDRDSTGERLMGTLEQKAVHWQGSCGFPQRRALEPGEVRRRRQHYFCTHSDQMCPRPTATAAMRPTAGSGCPPFSPPPSQRGSEDQQLSPFWSLYGLSLYCSLGVRYPKPFINWY